MGIQIEQSQTTNTNVEVYINYPFDSTHDISKSIHILTDHTVTHIEQKENTRFLLHKMLIKKSKVILMYLNKIITNVPKCHTKI